MLHVPIPEGGSLSLNSGWGGSCRGLSRVQRRRRLWCRRLYPPRDIAPASMTLCRERRSGSRGRTIDGPRVIALPFPRRRESGEDTTDGRTHTGVLRTNLVLSLLRQYHQRYPVELGGSFLLAAMGGTDGVLSTFLGRRISLNTGIWSDTGSLRVVLGTTTGFTSNFLCPGGFIPKFFSIYG